MRLYVGTSGFSYKEWKGTFYPSDLPAAEMLRYYGERFETVEINNTFYRMPKASVLEQWRDQVGPEFSFVLKVPQRITHQKRLVDAGEDLQHFLEVSESLGALRGPALFQLPPYFRKDIEKLKAFVSLLPDGVRSAFEFRHESWFNDETYAVLREHDIALCNAEVDGESVMGGPQLPATASWGYLRLRRVEYAEDDLVRWHSWIAAQSWESAWVFFKHEDEGRGPELAKRFLELR